MWLCVMLPVIVGNLTGVGVDRVVAGAGFLLAYFCVTAALLLCFVILLFSMSLVLELLVQSVSALCAKRGDVGGI